jgi:hypothetical protein
MLAPNETLRGGEKYAVVMTAVLRAGFGTGTGLGGPDAWDTYAGGDMVECRAAACTASLRAGKT